MFDIRVGRIVWEFSDEIDGVQVSDVIVSIEGVTAGAYGHHLLIHDLTSVYSIYYIFCSLSHSQTGRTWTEQST